MFARLAILLLAYHYTSPALTAPYNPIPLERRNASLTSPTISTTIRAANGTDVTSSFTTLVYYQSADTTTTTPPASNLTDRQVRSVRRMDFCRSPRAEFLGSSCVHSRGSEFSLREYTVHCRQPRIPPYRLMMVQNFTGYPLDDLQYFSEEGTCLDHEICVNSMPQEGVEVQVATCVATKEFLEDPGEEGWIHGEEKEEGSTAGPYLGDVLRAVAAKRAGIVVSEQDASTPVELDSLEVDVGVEGGRGKMLQQTCRDCFGLRTKTAAPDADFLKIEATLMATAAMTGLIWVTVFAG